MHPSFPVPDMRYLALCAIALCPVAASAQEEPTTAPAAAPVDPNEARSRELFERGVEALNRHAWDEAASAFRQALELGERAGILVNLGTAQRQGGHLVEARATYGRYLERFPEHRQVAEVRRQVAEIDALMPRLTIHLEGAAATDRVFLDDEPITQFDQPFAANPGLREVTLRRGERVIQSLRVRIELEGNEEVTLRPIEVVVTETVTQTVTRTDDTPLVVGLVVGGVVLVGAAVAIGVVLAVDNAPVREQVQPTLFQGGLVYFN